MARYLYNFHQHVTDDDDSHTTHMVFQNTKKVGKSILHGWVLNYLVDCGEVRQVCYAPLAMRDGGIRQGIRAQRK